MIEYVSGDIFDVPDDERVVIAHCVNNVGLFGAGFAEEFALRYPNAKTTYLGEFVWANLGDVIIRDLTENVSVAHLFGQNGVRSRENPQPIRYGQLGDALWELGSTMLEAGFNYYVRMPRLGCGLAGGRWPMVSQLIEQKLTSRGVRVVVYDKP